MTGAPFIPPGGVVPPVEATGEPYGISRDMVEGAARAASAFSTSAPQGGRGLDAIRPVPALSQVTPTITPDSGVAGPHSGAEADPTDNEIGHVDSLRKSLMDGICPGGPTFALSMDSEPPVSSPNYLDSSPGRAGIMHDLDGYL